MKYVLCVAMVLAPAALYGVRTIEESTCYKKVELINNIRFEELDEWVNGARYQKWLVDGKQLDKAAFGDRKLAEKEREWRAELEREECERTKTHMMRLEEQRVILKKLIVHYKQRIDEVLKQLETFPLNEYVLFRPATIASMDDFLAIRADLFVRADMLVQSESEMLELKSMADKLEDIAQRIKKLFDETVRMAINRSDDPHVLRKLLELVS